jgi:hypothetical protein
MVDATAIWVAVIGAAVPILALLVQWKKVQAETRNLEAETSAIRGQSTSNAVAVARQHEEIDAVRFVLCHMLSSHERRFLMAIAGLEARTFNDGYRDRDHIRRVIDLGFAEKSGKNVADLQKGDDLGKEFRVTAAGSKYLELLNPR